MRKSGTITITTKPRFPGLTPEIDAAEAVAETKTLLAVEQWLNDHTATEVFRKFGVLIRVHL